MDDHIPVLLSELIAGLNIQPNKDYIDCTLGAGGHTNEVLKLNGPDGKVYGIDIDNQAIALARGNLKDFNERTIFINDDYSSLENIIERHKIDTSNLGGIFADLGLSTMQLEQDRGFSFQNNSPLDMNFASQGSLTAEDILNNWSEEEIGRLISENGEEKEWRKITRAIIDYRRHQTITMTQQLVDIINSVKPRKATDKIHPATKTFQALRITVNDELNHLRDWLPMAVKVLPSRARLAIISFHSLEDRIVKQFFRKEVRSCICPPELPQCICNHQQTIKIITTKPIRASADEVQVNPRARSAKLRIAEKI